MYNVIVADDEKNIREGIVELIEWEKLGVKFALLCKMAAASVEIFRRRKNTCRYYNNRYKDADYGWNGINRNA